MVYKGEFLAREPPFLCCLTDNKLDTCVTHIENCMASDNASTGIKCTVVRL